MPKSEKETFSKAEAKARFEAALRGARITGHKPLKDKPKVKKAKQKRTQNESGFSSLETAGPVVAPKLQRGVY
jgi:hypothetical protein